MDCYAYCDAVAYKIKPLIEGLRSNYTATLYRDVAHVEVPMEGKIYDVFYFPYGVAVCWDVSRDQGQQVLDLIKNYKHEPTEEIETDEFTYAVGHPAKIEEDEIVMPNLEVVSKLAVSHGIAQSVKLGTFENAVQKTFASTREIPEDLAKYGKISLSRKEIRKKMGALFIERNSINLLLDVLETPEFFWDYPELEVYYKMIAHYLDIKKRVEVLNHRLNIVHELFDMLGTELNHQHSSRLEWIIIYLIVLEVVISLSHQFFL